MLSVVYNFIYTHLHKIWGLCAKEEHTGLFYHVLVVSSSHSGNPRMFSQTEHKCAYVVLVTEVCVV